MGHRGEWFDSFSASLGLPRTDEKFPATLPILFPPQSMDNVLAEWLGKHKIPQFHTAETEKYAHVTFFFNGGREAAFPLEERKLVPSPKVATYDSKPEMSVSEVADAVVEAVQSDRFGFVMCNFAPPDMVGHTGALQPTVEACTATDLAVAKVKEACERAGYILVITADHGNAEDMLETAEDGTQIPKTAHSTYPVPLNVYFPEKVGTRGKLLGKTGGLKDVAPTVLALMGLQKPNEMDGNALVVLDQ